MTVNEKNSRNYQKLLESLRSFFFGSFDQILRGVCTIDHVQGCQVVWFFEISSQQKQTFANRIRLDKK